MVVCQNKILPKYPLFMTFRIMSLEHIQKVKIFKKLKKNGIFLPIKYEISYNTGDVRKFIQFAFFMQFQ